MPGTTPPREVRVLLVPADPAMRVELMVVADKAWAISDALGGCLLDDTTVGALPQGGWFTVYLADGDGPALSDVPAEVVTAAEQTGLTVTPAARRSGDPAQASGTQ